MPARRDCLGDDEIEAICEELGHTWRGRVFPPPVTVRSIVYRALYPDKAIDAVVADMAAAAPWSTPPTDAAWCQARDRLPEPVLPRLVRQSADRTIRL